MNGRQGFGKGRMHDGLAHVPPPRDILRHAPPANFHQSGTVGGRENFVLSATPVRLDVARRSRAAVGTEGKCGRDSGRTRHFGGGPDDADGARENRCNRCGASFPEMAMLDPEHPVFSKPGGANSPPGDGRIHRTGDPGRDDPPARRWRNFWKRWERNTR